MPKTPSPEVYGESVEQALVRRKVDAKSARSLMRCLGGSVNLHRKMGTSASGAAEHLLATAATFLPLEAAALRTALDELQQLESLVREGRAAVTFTGLADRLLITRGVIAALKPLLLGDSPCETSSTPPSSDSASASSPSSPTPRSSDTASAGGPPQQSSDGQPTASSASSTETAACAVG